MTNVIRFIGDVHGKFRQYKRIIKDCKRSIQVGDMGVGFKRLVGGEIKPDHNPPFDSMSQGDHTFIRGNHDNPQACTNHHYFIPDGSIIDNHIYCLGGAVSIDRAWRTEGYDWWPDEECSVQRLEMEVALFKDFKPDVVVTHDCPESIARMMMDELKIYDKDKFPSRTRQALESMFHFHQPKLWVFGHWHKTITFPVQHTLGTTFKCLGELEYEDIDTDEYRS